MVVVPPGHEVLKRMAATLEIWIEANPPLTVLLVRQERVSELWSGIVLSHELSHLMDRGGGKPYFPALEQEIRLRLQGTRTFRCGAVYLRYRRA